MGSGEDATAATNDPILGSLHVQLDQNVALQNVCIEDIVQPRLTDATERLGGRLREFCLRYLSDRRRDDAGP